MTPPAITKCWTFRSSKGDRHYQTLLYADGSTSCDCPGWCKRIAADRSRSCKHTRSVMLGTADQEAESSHDSRQPAAVPTAPQHSADQVHDRFGQIGRRKLNL